MEAVPARRWSTHTCGMLFLLNCLSNGRKPIPRFAYCLETLFHMMLRPLGEINGIEAKQCRTQYLLSAARLEHVWISEVHNLLAAEVRRVIVDVCYVVGVDRRLDW